MFPFKEKYQTANISRNSKKEPIKMNPRYIILHHTGTGKNTLKGNLNALLGKTTRQVSAHFLVDYNGDAYKLSEPTFITWHAGVSSWGKLKNMNSYSLGIEVIGINEFSDAQRKTVKDLVQHLMAAYNIPKENVLRHADIAPKRKTDISLNFFPSNDFNTWVDSLYPKLI